MCQPMFGSRGGEGTRGPDPPLENYKNIGFLSNTGPVPLKITKLQIQHSMLGHHRPAREMPFKRCFAVLPPLVKLKKKVIVKVGPPQTKLSGSGHAADDSHEILSHICFISKLSTLKYLFCCKFFKCFMENVRDPFWAPSTSLIT